MLSGEKSPRQLLRWCFIAIVFAPGKHLTETVDFIPLFNRQPSTCFTIESRGMSVFFLWGILGHKSWFIFWLNLLLILCKLMLLSSVFGEPHDLFVEGLCFSSWTFSWCKFGGNATELIFAGTQWFSASDLMMDALVKFLLIFLPSVFYSFCSENVNISLFLSIGLEYFLEMMFSLKSLNFVCINFQKLVLPQFVCI